ncbi:TPA: SMR family transporter, partial [Klebsiella pneumoniae]|nr:hypothetical protein [Klebsiella pneumoniae]HDU6166749.1 hypothetical protein [Klebsiella pneumoniae subsp. pneumoniae]HCD7559527.1 hypothetical protein [Klebsiella pneumoniae]HCD7871859.1 hypothetical protein [Klebsiella pneumoniae]HCJ5552453.1 hypothetical protein [Klebsiella pneumoniae]
SIPVGVAYAVWSGIGSINHLFAPHPKYLT